MSTNKKSTTKSTKSPTPATKITKAGGKKKAAAETLAPAAAAVESTPVLTPAAPVAVATVKVEEAPAAPVSLKPLVTTIRARIDIGFGNQLYLRGDGAGLSWDRGVVMTNVAADEWQITLPESARPVVFKFLINDQGWSTGPDYSVIPGTSTAVTPAF